MRTRIPLLLPVLVLPVLAVQLHAQQLDVQEFVLANGLKVVVVGDRTIPSVCFAIAFRVGGRNEHPGITGISHLFEHMMFNGSRKYKPLEFDRILEAGGGYSNAYTSNDITFYYEEFNPDLLEKVLDMEADRMRYLTIDTINLEQERGIVKEERRVSTDNNVRAKMVEDLYAAAFVAHPYRNPVVGWMKDLDNITLEDARQFFKTYYAPNNATIIIAGDVDGVSLRPKMEKYFGMIPPQPRPRPVNNAEPEQQGERRVKLHRAAELPSVAIGYKAVSVSSPDFHALSLLASILARGQSSRLHRHLVYDMELATEVGASMDELIDPGLFTIFAQLQPGRTVEEAEREIYGIIGRIADEGVTPEELQKARNTAQVDYINEFKTNYGVAGRLGYYEVVYGGYRASFNVFQHYDAVTPEDVQRVARTYLTDLRRTVVVLVPERGDELRGLTTP